jgi:hypothetical protein
MITYFRMKISLYNKHRQNKIIITEINSIKADYKKKNSGLLSWIKHIIYLHKTAVYIHMRAESLSSLLVFMERDSRLYI